MVLVVVWFSVGLALAAFAAFLYFGVIAHHLARKRLLGPKPQAPPTGAPRAGPSAVPDPSKSLDALRKLAETFAKVGPAVICAILSMFFLLVASVTALIAA